MDKIVVLVPAHISSSPNKALASEAASAVATPQPDLLYMDSILVSTGENSNDDVFLHEEMWKARHSPRLKPVDWEHETGSEVSDDEFVKDPKKPVVGNQIIGVMYNTYVTDKEGNVIEEEKAQASDFTIPSAFHIIDQAAIYSALFPKTAAKIAKGAKENSLFVSMEAWFDNYDYLVGTRIIARNEQTALLDKNLRARGGSGMFQNAPIKRVLRNITFGGKGIVVKPANKASIIKSVTNSPVQAQASEVYNDKAIASNVIGEITQDGKVNLKESSMADEKTVNLSLTVADYKEVLQSKAALELTVKQKDEELAKAKTLATEAITAVDSLKALIAKGGEALDAALPGLKAKLAASKPEQLFAVVASEASALKAKAEEIAKKLEAAEAKLAESAKAAKTAERRSALATSLKAEGEKLDKLVAFTKDMADEAFAAYVASTKELLDSSEAAFVDFKKKKEEEEEKKKKDAKATEDKAAADKAEADKKVAEAAAKAAEVAKASASAPQSLGITDPKILEKIKASVTPSPGVDNTNKGVDLKVAYAGLANTIIGSNKTVKEE